MKLNGKAAALADRQRTPDINNLMAGPACSHSSILGRQRRASRLLSDLSLYRDGYDLTRLFTLIEAYDCDRSASYAALQVVREHDMDLTG